MADKKSTPKKGQPYHDSIYDDMLEKISEGKSLNSLCKQDQYPSMPVFRKKVNGDPSFANKYAHARLERSDVIFEDCLDIADKSENDIDELGQVNHENIQRAKLRIDTRKWMLGKMHPRKYGDKVEIESTNINLNTELDEHTRKIALDKILKSSKEFDDYR